MLTREVISNWDLDRIHGEILDSLNRWSIYRDAPASDIDLVLTKYGLDCHLDHYLGTLFVKNLLRVFKTQFKHREETLLMIADTSQGLAPWYANESQLAAVFTEMCNEVYKIESNRHQYFCEVGVDRDMFTAVVDLLISRSMEIFGVALDNRTISFLANFILKNPHGDIYMINDEDNAVHRFARKVFSESRMISSTTLKVASCLSGDASPGTFFPKGCFNEFFEAAGIRMDEAGL